MATLAPFVPVQPPRTADWMPGWRGLFGERMRNTIYGWPEPAFDEFYRKRRILGFNVHIVTDPDMVGRVLLDNKENYIRPRIAQRILSPLIGNGLLSSEGEDWKKQRRIVAPTFAPGAVAKMTGAISHVAARQTDGWLRGTLRVDMARAATDATMQIIADTLFSSDSRLTARAAGQHIENLVMASGQARILTILGLQNLDLTPMMARARRGRTYLRNTLTEMVRERGPTGGADDFFGGLIRALHEQFPAAEAEALSVDNAITFYVAGHETTANALTWTWYLLSQNPEAEAKLHAELDAVLAPTTPSAEAAASPPQAGGELRVPTVEDLPNLKYTEAVLAESMRLYPPAWTVGRLAVEDHEFGGFKIPKGSLVLASQFVMHHDARFWEDANAFVPERWEKLSVKEAGQQNIYFPFGGGVRRCIGESFAWMEGILLLAAIARKWKMRLMPEQVIGLQPMMTLRPKFGMKMIAEARTK